MSLGSQRNTNASAPQSSFDIGPVRVEPERNVLIIEKQERRLEPKIMDILVCLAEARGQTVSKAELLDKVWADRFVVEAVLKRGIHELRKVLKDDARSPRYIQTVTKRGYRLLEPVTFDEISVEKEKTNTATGHPYHGLDCFNYSDANYFVGREQQVNDVLNAMRIQEHRNRSFLLVSGPSGAGKSSLIRAGVIPHLVRHGLGGQQETWLRAEFVLGRSGGSPLNTMANALLQPTALTMLNPNTFKTKELQDLLASEPSEFIRWLQGQLDTAECNKTRLVLLIDQFEELLVTDHTEIPLLFALIHTFARSGLVWVIATLRNDFFPEFAKFDALLRLRQGSGNIDIQPPGAAQIGRIIREPARRAGLSFEHSSHGVGLDDVLQDECRDHPDILPLLQFTLTQLYQRRTSDRQLTFAAYEALGGIDGCVAQHAETVFNQLSTEVQNALPHIMAQLVVPMKTKRNNFACRPMLLREQEHVSTSDLINQFVDARLLSASMTRDGDRWIRFTHQSVIQHWPRARDWLQQNQEQVQIKEWLDEQVNRWHSANCDSDFLLSPGKPLSDANTLFNSSEVLLTATEREFIQQSQEREQRRHRLRQSGMGALAAISALAVLAAFNAHHAQRLAQEQSVAANHVTKFLTDTFTMANPGLRTPEVPTARNLLDQGVARIDGEFAEQPAVESALRLAMGDAYVGLGLYDEAESQLRRALELRTHSELDRAAVQVSLGALLRATGKLKEAQRLLSNALTIQRDQLNEPDPVIAKTLDELGMVAHAQGNFDKAVPLLSEALAIREQVLGEQALEVADSLNNLAAVGMQLGELDVTIKQYDRAILIYRNHKEVARLRLANAMSNAAGIHHAMHDLATAGDLYQDAIAIYQSYRQIPDADIAVLQSNYGSLLRDSGELIAAKNVLASAYASAGSSLGLKHTRTHQIAIKLADIHIRLGELREASALLEKTLTALDSEFGNTHWLSAYTRSVLASKLHAEGDPAAVSMSRSALVIIEEALGAESPYTIDARRRLERVSQVVSVE